MTKPITLSLHMHTGYKQESVFLIKILIVGIKHSLVCYDSWWPQTLIIPIPITLPKKRAGGCACIHVVATRYFHVVLAIVYITSCTFPHARVIIDPLPDYDPQLTGCQQNLRNKNVLFLPWCIQLLITKPPVCSTLVIMIMTHTLLRGILNHNWLP